MVQLSIATIRIRQDFWGSSVALCDTPQEETYRRVALSASSSGRGGRVGHAEAIGGFAVRASVGDENEVQMPSTAISQGHGGRSEPQPQPFACRTLVEMASSSTASLSLCPCRARVRGRSMRARQESTARAAVTTHCCPAAAGGGKTTPRSSCSTAVRCRGQPARAQSAPD